MTVLYRKIVYVCDHPFSERYAEIFGVQEALKIEWQPEVWVLGFLGVSEVKPISGNILFVTRLLEDWAELKRRLGALTNHDVVFLISGVTRAERKSHRSLRSALPNNCYVITAETRSNRFFRTDRGQRLNSIKIKFLFLLKVLRERKGHYGHHRNFARAALLLIQSFELSLYGLLPQARKIDVVFHDGDYPLIDQVLLDSHTKFVNLNYRSLSEFTSSAKEHEHPKRYSYLEVETPEEFALLIDPGSFLHTDNWKVKGFTTKKFDDAVAQIRVEWIPVLTAVARMTGLCVIVAEHPNSLADESFNLWSPFRKIRGSSEYLASNASLVIGSTSTLMAHIMECGIPSIILDLDRSTTQLWPKWEKFIFLEKAKRYPIHTAIWNRRDETTWTLPSSFVSPPGLGNDYLSDRTKGYVRKSNLIEGIQQFLDSAEFEGSDCESRIA